MQQEQRAEPHACHSLLKRTLPRETEIKGSSVSVVLGYLDLAYLDSCKDGASAVTGHRLGAPVTSRATSETPTTLRLSRTYFRSLPTSPKAGTYVNFMEKRVGCAEVCHSGRLRCLVLRPLALSHLSISCSVIYRESLADGDRKPSQTVLQ